MANILWVVFDDPRRIGGMGCRPKWWRLIAVYLEYTSKWSSKYQITDSHYYQPWIDKRCCKTGPKSTAQRGLPLDEFVFLPLMFDNSHLFYGLNPQHLRDNILGITKIAEIYSLLSLENISINKKNRNCFLEVILRLQRRGIQLQATRCWHKGSDASHTVCPCGNSRGFEESRHVDIVIIPCGGFLKLGYPQIIYL